jgi:hypothetical protein
MPPARALRRIQYLLRDQRPQAATAGLQRTASIPERRSPEPMNAARHPVQVPHRPTRNGERCSHRRTAPILHGRASRAAQAVRSPRCPAGLNHTSRQHRRGHILAVLHGFRGHRVRAAGRAIRRIFRVAAAASATLCEARTAGRRTWRRHSPTRQQGPVPRGCTWAESISAGPRWAAGRRSAECSSQPLIRSHPTLHRPAPAVTGKTCHYPAAHRSGWLGCLLTAIVGQRSIRP